MGGAGGFPFSYLSLGRTFPFLALREIGLDRGLLNLADGNFGKTFRP